MYRLLPRVAEKAGRAGVAGAEESIWVVARNPWGGRGDHLKPAHVTDLMGERGEDYHVERIGIGAAVLRAWGIGWGRIWPAKHRVEHIRLVAMITIGRRSVETGPVPQTRRDGDISFLAGPHAISPGIAETIVETGAVDGTVDVNPL